MSEATAPLSPSQRFQAVVVGVSMGGLEALRRLFNRLDAQFPLPIMVVQHLGAGSGDGLGPLLDAMCPIHIKEADDGEVPQPGTVYLAPANYHLLVELDGTLGLSIDEPVNFARPSVDVLFESAAATFGPGLIGVLLTGAGRDGSQGLLTIQQLGGQTLVQDPRDAVADSMPLSALQVLKPDAILPLEALADHLQCLAQNSQMFDTGPKRLI